MKPTVTAFPAKVYEEMPQEISPLDVPDEDDVPAFVPGEDAVPALVPGDDAVPALGPPLIGQSLTKVAEEEVEYLDRKLSGDEHGCRS